ncbi:MAG: DUF3466 family protein, partial [Solirubrobacteraceae bacterium]
MALVVWVVLLMAFGAPARAATSSYNIIDLGTLPGGTDSFATGVNDSGLIVGYGESSGVEHAFAYPSGGPMQDLGTFPGGTSSGANGVNDSGLIVGQGESSGVGHA